MRRTLLLGLVATALVAVAMINATRPAVAIPIDICVVGQASCPTSEPQCLDEGWQTFTDIAGNPRFTSEPECIDFVKENFEIVSTPSVPDEQQSYCAWYWEDWYGWYYWCY
jgi:hypothetical protein